MYDLPLSRDEDVEDHAASIASELGSVTPPLDPNAILKRLGVICLPLRSGSAEAELHRDTQPFRVHFKDSGYRRQRFTAAHEIGHLVLHPDVFEPLHRESPAIRRAKAKQGDVVYCTRENEADAFAAALLMPARWIERDFTSAAAHYWKQSWVSALTYKYAVSTGTLLRRFAWLRRGIIISGEADVNSGRIRWAFPSLDLAESDGPLARAVWLSNDVIPGGRTCWLPNRLTGQFVPRNVPQRTEMMVNVRTLFPTASIGHRGELWLCPHSDGMVFFDLVVE